MKQHLHLASSAPIRIAGLLVLLLLLLAGRALPGEHGGPASPVDAGWNNTWVWQFSYHEQTLTIIGSVHMGDARALYGNEIIGYLAASQVVGQELANDLVAKEAAEQLETLMRNPPGVDLARQVPDDLLPALTGSLANFGVDIKMLDAYRPLFVAQALGYMAAARDGLFPQQGLESQLATHMSGKERLLLEPIKAVLPRFATISHEDEIDLLRMALANAKPGISRAVFTAYVAGDVAALLRLQEDAFSSLDQERGKRLRHLMLLDRNATMAESILSVLGAKKDMTAIMGVMHCLGEQSVVDLLIAAGCRARKAPSAR